MLENNEEAVIRAVFLKKQYSGKKIDVLQQPTFSVERGKLLGMIGPVKL